MIDWCLILVFGGIAVTTFLVGFIVRWALDWMTAKYKVPDEVDPEVWATVVAGTEGFSDRGGVAGRLIGWLERLLYVAAIWHGAVAIIPGWLAVKVATKWQSWSKLLGDIDIHPDLEIMKLHAIRYFSWRLSQRFLLGNLLNVLFAGAIYFWAQEILNFWN